MYNTSCANLKGKNENNVVSCPVPIFRPDLFRHQQLPIFSEMISSVSYIQSNTASSVWSEASLFVKGSTVPPHVLIARSPTVFSLSASAIYYVPEHPSIHSADPAHPSNSPAPDYFFFCTGDKDFWLETVLIDTMVTITSEFFLRNAFGKEKKNSPGTKSSYSTEQSTKFSFFLCFLL